MRNNLIRTRSAISLSILLAMSAPAVAEHVIVTANPAPSATVSTGDFNLASAAGLAAVKHRIRAVAADLCLTNAVEPVDIRMARAKCFRAAVADGNRQIERMVAARGAAPMDAVAVILTKTGG